MASLFCHGFGGTKQVRFELVSPPRANTLIGAYLVFNPSRVVTNPHVVVFLSVKAGMEDQVIVLYMLLPRSQASQLPFPFNFYQNRTATIAIS